MRDRWAIVLICLAVLVAYLETIFNGFVFDDDGTVLGCELITSLGNLPHLFTDQYFTMTIERSWRPLPTFSLFIDHALFGYWPGGYHLFNMLYHLLATLSLWLLLRFTLATAGGPLIAALIFAVHPLGTEAVNGISFREDLFVGILTPLAVLLGMGVIMGVRGKKAAIAAGALTLLACLSKESGVVIPVLLAVWWWLWAEPRWTRSTKLTLVGSLVAAVALFWLLCFRIYTFPDPAPAPAWGGDRMTALWNFPRIVFHFMRVFVWPTGLSADYDWTAVHAFSGIGLWLGWLGMGLLTLFAFSLRGWVPLLGLGILWYVLSLGPVSNIVPIYNPVADRYLYVPMMGLCIVVAWVVDRMGDWPALWSLTGRRLGILVLVIALTLLLHQTVWRNHVWGDEQLLWESTLEVSPNSTKALNNLAALLIIQSEQEGDIEPLYQAEDYLIRVLEMEGTITGTVMNLGVVQLRLGKWEAARYHLELMIQSGLNPAMAHHWMGRWHLENPDGDPREALRHLETSANLGFPHGAEDIAEARKAVIQQESANHE